MKHAYSSKFIPPAPSIPVRLSVPEVAPQSEALAALLDTGADATLVGLNYLERIGARQIGERLVRGLWSGQVAIAEFEIDIHIEGLTFPSIQVLANAEADEILLGRNVLNKLALLLDGPHEITETLER